MKISDFYIWEDQDKTPDRVKDVEIGWERKAVLNSEYLKFIIPKIIEIIEKYGISIPLSEMEHYPQDQQLIELILKLPDEKKTKRQKNHGRILAKD